MEISGSCYMIMSYDIGLQVDVDAAEKRLSVATQRTEIVPRHRAPKHFEYRSKPLRMSQRADEIRIGNFTTLSSVDAVLFDFGTVSITYCIPFKTDFPGLLDLSDCLYDNAAIRLDSERRARDFLNAIKPAVSKPLLSDFVEDYLIFELKKTPHNPDHQELIDNHRQELAQILRSEKLQLSDQEIEETLSESLSYTPSDNVIVNWNAALVYDDDADDVRAVLEFANMQLLELRYLDKQLDKSLDECYDMLTRKRKSSFWLLFSGSDADVNRAAQLQADAAFLFEGISSSLKLLGDQYLSRIYSMTARRFHIRDWDSSITKKLATIDSIYQKLEDKVDSLRMQLMELVIVLLIMIEIVIPFIPGFKH